MFRILGIDPGLRCTGYGVIETDGHRHRYIASGQIRPPKGSMASRLGHLHRELGGQLEVHQPHCVSIETSFVALNSGIALKLGQARGALISACALCDLEVHEYSPRAMKRSITGLGQAEKDQVNFMVQLLLNLSAPPQADEADALGLALCHAHNQGTSLQELVS